MRQPIHPLARDLEAHLKTTGLLRPGDAVLVALSGGMDSVCLLHLLRFGLADWRLRLRAAHVDHAMRPDSAADAAWVRGLCRAWDVPLRAERLEHAPTGEADARDARYAMLDGVAVSGEHIVTAHHADDQAETLIFRMARGTGIRGLRGIPPRRGRLVRPLLRFSRDELAVYAAATNLSWRDDPTNVDTRLSRNRIRHGVLAALEAVHPGATSALSRLAGLARENEDAWDWVLDGLERNAIVREDGGETVLARPSLHSYHRHAAARLLRRVLRRHGCVPDEAGTMAALEFITTGPSGGGLDLPGGIRLERSFDEILIRSAHGTAADRTTSGWPVTIRDTGPDEAVAVVDGQAIRVTWGPGRDPGQEEGEPLRCAVEPRAGTFPLEIRSWRPGDRIRFSYGRKKLKKLLAEARIGRFERGRVPVLADAEGRVLWVAGVARSVDAGSPEADFTISVAHGEQR